MTLISVKTFFYPVGQGLFSSGHISLDEFTSVGFSWVYDCGTLSKQAYVEAGIRKLEEELNNKTIDLLIISHFDRDHISGVCELIKKFKIKTILLPYMTLAQRVWIAFEEGVSLDDDLMVFFVNPVNYIASIEGEGSVERIVLIYPSSQEGDGDDWDLDSDGVFPSNSLISSDQLKDEGLVLNNGNIEVYSFQRSLRLVWKNIWEFVPYNDDRKHVVSSRFSEMVRGSLDKLMLGKTDVFRKRALEALKAEYDGEFGGGAEDRNIISLFLYSGPLGRIINFKSYIFLSKFSYFFPRVKSYNYWNIFHKTPHFNELEGILYTGDAYLDTLEAFDNFKKYFAKNGRLSRVLIFQVMHHGSESNWHKGIAAKINPGMSVFSSDPERRKWSHPHASVLRDFWRNNPIQVDKYIGARFKMKYLV